jgi:hypothetical protein
MKSVFLFLSISLYSALAFGQDCNAVSINGGNGQINVSGLTGAPNIVVQVFNSSWASVFNQTYTNSPGNVSVSPLSAGTYYANVRFYNSSWALLCEKSSNATVTSGSPAPVDSCGATFQKTFGLAAGNDEAGTLAKASDGGYLIAGYTAASGTTNYDGLIMKLDSKGSLLWSKVLGGAQNELFAYVISTGDGGGLAAGQTNSTGYGTYSGDTWLVRFDASGDVIWQKRYFLSGNPGNVHAIIQTSDGGFALTGTFPFTPGVSDWGIVKLDANGNIQWQKKLGSGSSDSGTGIVEDNHGGAGLVVSGVVYSGTWYDAIISKLDLTTGNLLWTKSYDFDSRANWTGTLQKVADGIILNTVNADGYGSENAKPGIMKIDFSGNLMWVKDYTIANCREGRSIVLPDGGFMMVQSELPHDAASDIYLMRIDAAGAIMWTKKYPRAGAEWLNGIIADGNLIAGAGLATVGSYNDVLVARTDLNGKFGSCPSQNVTGTSRNCVVTNLNFSWPTNTTLTLTAANTAYTVNSTGLVENVLCSDGCPNITIGNVTVSENAGNASVQVCLAAPVANTLVYNYTTANGTATSGSDYTGGAGTVTILAGQTCGTISIPITNDATEESAENFTVSIGSVTGIVTINDDDQALNTCSSVTITPGSNVITVTGVTAPVATVQVFNSSWTSVFNQTYTNSPGTVTVNIGPGTYLVKVTFYTSSWGYVCDKSENVTVVNNCPAGTICVSNTCPSQTVNLNTAYSIPNLPAGTTVSWHTGTPATDANRMTDQQAQNVSVSGTYYAAINISGAGCYSATIAVNVTIVPCSSPAMETRMVQVASEGQPSARKITAFPNPFTSSVRVIIDSEKKERATLVLMDVQGRQLKQLPVQLQPGSNSVLLDGLDKFTQGNYFLKINSGGEVKTLKVVRQQ